MYGLMRADDGMLVTGITDNGLVSCQSHLQAMPWRTDSLREAVTFQNKRERIFKPYMDRLVIVELAEVTEPRYVHREV